MMMKTSMFLLAITVMPSLAIAATGDLLWSDEFNGGSLNTQYWNYDLGTGQWGWGNGELQSYTDNIENVKVQDSKLQITARRNEDGSGFTSGRLNTAGKMEFKYGRVEAFINVPDVADGLWPAFWTLGNTFYQDGWPDAGEIDIMEIGQGLAITEGVVNKRIISGAHWENDDQLAAYALWLDYPENLNLRYRNYTLDWTPTKMITFVDGQMIWEMDISPEACPDCEEFHRPHFLVTNLAVGGLFTSTGSSESSSAAGGCSESSSAASATSSSNGGCSQARTDVSAPLPASMFVEYVRIIDNGFAEVFTVDNIFQPVPQPAALPTVAPQSSPTPAPVAPQPNPTLAPVTQAPQTGPTSSPVAVGGSPTPQPQQFESPSAPNESTDRSDPVPNPTPAPVASSTESGTTLAPVPATTEGGGVDEDSDCESMNESSGKSGKGEGDRKRARRHRRRLECDESSGKSGKGKSSKKSGSSADEDTVAVAFASLQDNSSADVSQQKGLPAAVLSIVVLVLSGFFI